jgi:broad specificity phosphatase PhoE/ADP-ribose pyrophosphatase YjhB (NUDIX family)
VSVEWSTGKDAERQPGDREPGVARIYLARHGRTPLNAAGVLRGHLDPLLDAVGRQQAEWLGVALGDRGARLVVASPLRRAVETAQAVATRAHVDVEIDPRLIDRDYGRWAGQPKEDVEAQWGTVDEAPGVEPAAEVRARAWEALADIARQIQGGVAVVVSHDAPNRLILAALDPGLADPDQLPQETGCFNTLDYRDGRWTVVSVNEVPGAPADRPSTKVRDGNRRPTPTKGARMVMLDNGELVDLRCSVLLFRDDSVLLCRRTDREDVWVLPGGTPRGGEGTAAAAQREVEEETGIKVAAERVAFVLETSSWNRMYHRIEIVFLGADRDRRTVPAQLEENLEPSFVALADLDKIGLRPPMAGYIRGFARSGQATASYLGNLWRPDVDDATSAVED